MGTAENIQKHPIGLEDLQLVGNLSSASISADGRYLAFVNSKIDWEENTHNDFITILDLSTGQEEKTWPGSSPKWSPVKNELAYLCDYKGQSFIWVYSMVNESKRSLAPVYESHYFMGHLALANFAWSPDGLMIAYVGSHQYTDSNTDQAGVRVIERLLYKTKGGRGRPAVTDERLCHIWVVSTESGDPQLITDTIYNEHSVCWSPDGKQLAFVSNRSADPDNNQLHDLWSIDLISYQTTRHTENFGTVHQPAWSPDGNHIAFLGTRSLIGTNDSPAEDTQLYITGINHNELRCISQAFDRRVEQPSWHPGGEAIYFTAGNHGTTSIYRIAIRSELVESVAGHDCQVIEYAVTKSGEEVCFITTDPTHLTEIFVQDLINGSSRQITNNSCTLLDKCYLQPARSFWFESFDQTLVQGWIIKPSKLLPEKKYPLVLVIHGGPHNMFGFAFEDRMQVLSASGYGVLYINPRGSSGYGQAFSNGTLSNWGGGDYQDLMAGLNTALNQNDWIDADRLGVTGQSYGGFMTNWIITQTDRFKAAVTDGGISNLISFAGTSLYHSLIEAEFNGSAYDNFALLWKCSPIRNIKNVKTPTLILHGALDNEVPVSQAEEMYIALKKLGVDTMFVQYLDEGHGWRPDLKPRNRHDLLSRTIGWFHKYLAEQDT